MHAIGRRVQGSDWCMVNPGSEIGGERAHIVERHGDRVGKQPHVGHRRYSKIHRASDSVGPTRAIRSVQHALGCVGDTMRVG